MTAWAYYNDNDPFAVGWLRELIKDGLIAPGEVDDRSIEDVTPDDLRPFRQVHFFAGIGVWSLAARLAGIPDDARLWSGSCPCQPFSAAGKGEGFDDERHLWPAFHYLIEQSEPLLVVGEQVTGADGDLWLDLVSADLDATGYGFGAAETCAAGFGAPHERSRNYWLAHRLGARLEGYGGDGDVRYESGRLGAVPARPIAAGGVFGGMGHDPRVGREGRQSIAAAGARHQHAGAGETDGVADAEHHDGRADQPERGSDQRAVDGGLGAAMRLADAPDGDRRGGKRGAETGTGPDGERRRGSTGGDAAGGLAVADGDGREPGGLPIRQGRSDEAAPVEHRRRAPMRPGPVNGLWGDADWLFCRDDRWRPVGPGSFPLVDAGTVRNRVGLLRGAGNAVNLAQATGFLIAARQALKI